MTKDKRKNPAELPASRLNSGAGTEKRPNKLTRMIITDEQERSRKKCRKIRRSRLTSKCVALSLFPALL
jgi:hypothetical protein